MDLDRRSDDFMGDGVEWRVDEHAEQRSNSRARAETTDWPEESLSTSKLVQSSRDVKYAEKETLRFSASPC
jgi:hypothetical protein